MLYDVIVVGSGIAGLFSALYAKKNGSSVAILTKSNPFRSNSSVASGGINAVINFSEYDSILHHINDTIAGADGLINEKNISGMCHDAADIIEELKTMGVSFDSYENGEIMQRPFGGTKATRTCYIADRTGSAIVQKLLLECRNAGVHILSNHQFLNITKYKERLSGVTVLRRRDSQVIALACRSLVLAGGGYAGIYRGHSTNSQESSGDIIAAALRANMKLSNMEFVQFHPTTLVTNGALVTEAARGEGAYLVDESGVRFTDELQTRDKLSREITQHILNGHKVYLDFRHLSPELIETKLPSTQKIALNSAGIDITTELLEITPSAHYSIGGIWTRGDTSTEIPGIFACGECAVTGVHGANRLGGNSLLEGIYFGRLAGSEAAKRVRRNDFLPIDYATINKELRRIDVIIDGESHFNINSMRKNLGETLFKKVGVFRDESSLVDAYEYVEYLLQKQYGIHCVNKDREYNVELSSILEFQNALYIAEILILSALKREESRGVHYRSDFPIRDDIKFASPSYVKPLDENLFEITFENVVLDDLWHRFKKVFKN
ncbi:MAG: succinate dehydrogenase/fumarate reductase flavoprotein subunit [Sulfurimonas sp.]|jgi:succinate dehydrogenase/fumarate reductase flavoprotein subunit|uniref:FAD-dependent oxidoreductase n=1 Tax=Sulfurimonas sp. TaxID=2022749 RepID=UPI0039E5D3AA